MRAKIHRPIPELGDNWYGDCPVRVVTVDRIIGEWADIFVSGICIEVPRSCLFDIEYENENDA